MNVQLLAALQQAQIVGQRFKTTGAQPTSDLGLDRISRRQIVGHDPPRTPRAYQPAQAVEEFAEQILALKRILFHPRQIRHAEYLLFVLHITRILQAICRSPQK